LTYPPLLYAWLFANVGDRTPLLSTKGSLLDYNGSATAPRRRGLQPPNPRRSV